MKDLTGAMSAGAAAVLGDAKDKAEDAVRVVKDAAERAGGRAAELGGQAYERGKDAARQIGKEPVTAALLAGAVGVLVGYLLARRPSSS